MAALSYFVVDDKMHACVDGRQPDERARFWEANLRPTYPHIRELIELSITIS